VGDHAAAFALDQTSRMPRVSKVQLWRVNLGESRLILIVARQCNGFSAENSFLLSH